MKNAVRIGSSSNAAVTVVVTETNHNLNTNDVVTFARHTKETPVNFTETSLPYSITKIDDVTFSVAVDSSGDAAPGTGGVVGPIWEETSLLTWDNWLDVADFYPDPDPNEADGGNYTTAPGFTSWNSPVPILKKEYALQNVHIGTKVDAKRGHHATHGFVDFKIPKPFFVKIGPLSSGFDVRIEGYFFVAADPTATQAPSTSPPLGGPYGFDGTIGGSWVFFRESATLEEMPVSEVNFETGYNPEKSVINIDGTLQKSDGHILEVDIPDLVNEGFYDIILRQYRPYQLEPGGATQYHMDEIIAEKVFYYTHAEGFAGEPWGNVPFGGA